MALSWLRTLASTALILVILPVASNPQGFSGGSRKIGGGLNYCIVARTDIPRNSSQPLFTLAFASPNSGSVFIDQKEIKTFSDQQELIVYADVSAGKHRLHVRLKAPGILVSQSSNEDFKYCR
jgi:hypothetical protein